MIVSKTPLRISFFGGGSDIPEFYNESTGCVVSTTIDRFIHIAANRCQPDHARVIYSEIDVAPTVEGLRHDRAREVLKYFGYRSNIEICSFSDISTKGSGLGSSSTYTVGLIEALTQMNSEKLSRYDLAELASHIEINKCNQPIGKQDQYAAAFGGLNMIMFEGDVVEVVPWNKFTQASTILDLERNLMMFDTGLTRSTADILGPQVERLRTRANHDYTCQLASMATDSVSLLTNDKLDDFGALLHEGWMLKKKLSEGISNDFIDEMYSTARKAGALGGKILGAGGGGFMLLYVPEQFKNNVLTTMLERYNLFDFGFDYKGPKVTEL